MLFSKGSCSKKIFGYIVLTMMCTAAFPLANAKGIKTNDKNENWVLISEDGSIHRKIDHDLESYIKESGKEVSKEEVEEIINKFNDVVNKKLKEILGNMDKVMISKDVDVFSRILHKRMKRAVTSATSKIIAKFINGEVVNIELLGAEFVQSVVREAILGA